MQALSRKIKKYFGFDAASSIRLRYLIYPKRFFNVVKYLLNRNKHPLVLPYYPISLMVEVSTVCNLKCPGCERILYEKDHEIGGVPRENVKLENLNKLEKILPYVYSTYFVGGLGEPFLNKEFWDIHRFFKRFGVKTGYFSNASIIDEDKVRRTFEEKVDSVLISIDSHIKEKYEAIKKGSNFEKVVENVRLFSRYKEKTGNRKFQLGLNYIFMADNYKDVFGYLEFAKSLGVDFINFSSFIVHIDEEKDKAIFFISDEEKRAIFSEVERKAKGLGIRVRLPNITPEKGCMCYHMWHQVCIFYNGDVCACPFFRTNRDFYFHVDKNNKIIYEKRNYKDTILGNYLTQDFFTEIWNGARATDLRSSELNKDLKFNPCGSCYYKFDMH